MYNITHLREFYFLYCFYLITLRYSNNHFLSISDPEHIFENIQKDIEAFLSPCRKTNVIFLRIIFIIINEVSCIWITRSVTYKKRKSIIRERRL
ncbi:hypothetical protein SS31_03155 [Pluralibacter gergoviae]|nr:hypothetical protein SS31_03155 [Pluralibacter gergoviae]